MPIVAGVAFGIFLGVGVLVGLVGVAFVLVETVCRIFPSLLPWLVRAVSPKPSVVRVRVQPRKPPIGRQVIAPLSFAPAVSPVAEEPEIVVMMDADVEAHELVSGSAQFTMVNCFCVSAPHAPTVRRQLQERHAAAGNDDALAVLDDTSDDDLVREHLATEHTDSLYSQCLRAVEETRR